MNFRSLTAGTATYLDRAGVEKTVEEASPRVDGYQFHYMEGLGREFFAVGVDNQVLRAPVLLISERHTGGKGFFGGPQFDDDSAMRLLVDMIVANPESRDVLGRLIRQLGNATIRKPRKSRVE